MILAVALALVIVLPVALVAAVSFAMSPRDPLLRVEKPWACQLCDGEWPTQAGYLTHSCVMRVES